MLSMCWLSVPCGPSSPAPPLNWAHPGPEGLFELLVIYLLLWQGFLSVLKALSCWESRISPNTSSSTRISWVCNNFKANPKPFWGICSLVEPCGCQVYSFQNSHLLLFCNKKGFSLCPRVNCARRCNSQPFLALTVYSIWPGLAEGLRISWQFLLLKCACDGNNGLVCLFVFTCRNCKAFSY